MFLRFTKSQFDGIRKYKKCVFLGDSVIVEYGDKIVGAAKLHEETDKCFDYNIVVAAQCELSADSIARTIKDLIGKSNKFTANPTTKRRKYCVSKVDGAELPISAKIVFTKE